MDAPIVFVTLKYHEAELAVLRKQLAEVTVAAKEMLEDLKDAWAQEGKTEGWMENACVSWQAAIRAAEGAGDDLASVTRDLATGQEPLGADFEQVWDENTDKLHQP